MNYDTILIPTDGSEAAERAVDHAVDIASRRGATLHVLYVVDTDAVDLSLGAEQVDRIREGRFGEMTELKTRAEKAIGRVVQAADDEEIDVVESVTAGRPANQIVEYARDHEIDLVAMTTHRRSGVKKMLLGSVTEKVLRKASCPVLVVNND